MGFSNTFRGGSAALVGALDRSQAIIEFTPDGRILSANENFLKLLGYRLDEIKGRHHRMFVEADYAQSPAYREFWTKLAAGQYQAAQYKRVGKNGKEVWIEASYNPILDRRGRTVKVVKLASDVSTEKAVYADMLGKIEALDRSQAVIEFALDGTVLAANENFLQLLGYRLEEIKGRHHSMFVDPAEKQSSAYREFWAKLSRGEFQGAQYKRIGKGGKEVWIEATYNPIRDLNGKLCKVVKFATDLSRRKEQNAALAHDFEGGVKAMVTTVSSSTATMTETAQLLSAAAEQTNQQSAAVSTASEELTASIAEIARQLTQANKTIDTAVELAQNSRRTVGELVGAAEKIGEVTNLITEIASQTNLLALNATIEAARAGEAGKGFAVVASEVKTLATQTAKATEEIAQQIKSIQEASHGTEDAIRDITATVSQISEISTSISGAVEEQSTATRDVSENIQGVIAAARNTAQNAGSMQGVAQALSDKAGQLQKRVDDFLASVRAM
jgi:methyl-accepting chemotaxis protein